MGSDNSRTNAQDAGKAIGAAEQTALNGTPKIVRRIQSMPAWRFCTLMTIAVIWVLLQLWMKLTAAADPWIQYPLHLCLALIMVFLLNPMADRNKQRIWWMYDIFLIGSVLIVLWYFMSNAAMLNARIEGETPLTDTDRFVTLLLAAVLLEAVRRVVSNSLFVILIIFMGYAWFGAFIPGNLYHAGLSFSEFCEAVLLDRNGIFGVPLKASANTLFYFLVFGTFFSGCGGGKVLLDLGLRLSSRLTGGPAKAAVICSGLMGMVSGSAVANVAGTGVYTIPLMKKAGYSPEEAGSFESVASTGGQLMPPIMGAGAFIMAEILGVRYIRIAAASVLPALAYFGAAYIVAHLVSKKRHIGKHTHLYVDDKPIYSRLYRLLPVVILVILLIAGFSFSIAAIICTVISFGISLISKDTRKSPEGYAAMLLDGIRHAANIAVPTAACGLMCGVAVKTELAYRIMGVFQGFGQLKVLLIVAAVCLLLGMALPTIASYLIAYTLFMPSIMVFGISDFAANMFLFYFGVVAQITPPVCPASYTAAKLAEANAWKTGWKAYTYAAVAFIVPFMFIQHPAMITIGTPGEAAIAFGVLLAAIIWLAGGITGYLFSNLNPVERALLIAAGILLVIMLPLNGELSLLLGAGLGAAMTVYCAFKALVVSKRGNA